MARRVVWDSKRQAEWDREHGIVDAAPADNDASYAAAGAMIAGLGRNELPERAPSYRVGRDRNTYVPAPRSAPVLPSMPQMLPAEPEEAAVTAAALKAMMGTDFRDDARTKALGAALRTVTAGALLLITATLAWGALWIMAGVGWEWLPLAWLCALIVTIVYLLTSEKTGYKFSAAGVEHAKINASVEIHRDRLEARKEMHAAAVDAWERVMLKGLDRWSGGE